MKQYFTTVFVLAALFMSSAAFAQQAADSIPTDTLSADTLPVDTVVEEPAPVVVGADSIDVAANYLLYNVGLEQYLAVDGTAISNADSAAVWHFSAAQGATTVNSGDYYLTMNGSLLGGWSAGVGYAASNLTIRNTNGVFSFSMSVSLAGTRYLGFSNAGALAANQNNAGVRNNWLLVPTTKEVEPKPTVGYRILKTSGSASRVDYVIAYPSVRPDGSEVELSGTVCVPVRGTSLNADHFLLSSHFTMTKNTEVPSASAPMEATIYTMGGRPIMVAPDYLGYGISKDEVHPYVAPDIMARNCVDMLTAVHHLLLEKFNVVPDSLHLPTYGVGYSQGGSIALAIQKYIETSNDLTDAQRAAINYSGSNCGAGPYNPLATLSQYIYQDSLSMPVAAPLLVIGLVSSFPELMNGYTAQDYFSDAFNAAGLIDTIQTRNYTTSELNRMIIEACGGGTMHVMLSDSALDLNSALMQPFMKTLGMSDLTRDWTPQAPVHFFHNTGDDVVPFLNTMSAYRSLFDVAENGVSLAMTGSPQGHTEAAVSFMLPIFTGGYKRYTANDSILQYPISVKEPGRDSLAFWWHSVELEAGEGGTIYATGDWRLPLGEDDYGTNVLVNWVVAGKNAKSSLYAWAQPEEGYEFVGWMTEDSVLLSTEAAEARLWNMAVESANEDGIVNGTSYYPAQADSKIIAVFAPQSEGSATAVSTTVARPADNIMYDIMGRRIATSANGQIYIVNGKKYLRK